jgi:two-component system LytT family sensor kinase
LLSEFRLDNSVVKVIKSIISVIVIAAIVVFISFILFSAFGQHSKAQKLQPLAKDGIIDLAGWDFQTDGIVKLNGEWEFYWNKLIDPYQLSEQVINEKVSTVWVPGLWKTVKAGTNHLPDEGCATYRVLVKTGSISDSIAINVKYFISASRIWMDNKMVYEAGRVGVKSNISESRFNPRIIIIKPGSNQFYITVQISNFGYANGGFASGIELGDTLRIMNLKETGSYADMFLFGSILLMGLYHLALFCLRRKEYYTLYFSILCFIVSIRILVMGEMLIYSFLPEIPLYFILKLSGSSLSIGLPLFAMYLHSFFPEDTPVWFVRLTQAIGFFFTMITVIFRNDFRYLFLLPFQICSVFIILIILVILAKAVYKKRDASLLFFIATLSIALIVINDTLVGYRIINTGIYLPIGQVLFIFVQSFMLFRKLVNQEEKLIKSELRMLQAQIKPHFLFNALNTIIYVCRSSPEKAIGLLINLSDYLRCGFSFKNDEEFVDFDTEMLHVKSYLELEMARFSGKLKVIVDNDSDIDCKVPAFIIQPFVENAVKHGIFPMNDGGTVKLSAKQQNNILSIIIEDDGAGMTEEKLNSILNGTDKNAGIGVSNVKNRIKRIYNRDIEMKSELKRGTTVSLSIPINKGRIRSI